MDEVAVSTSDAEQRCYRCKTPIVGSHWFTVSVEYQGGGRFKNTERYICADCLAGIGMLELQKQTTEEEKEESFRDRLSLR